MNQDRSDIVQVRLYVDGELTPSECTTFEERLAGDETLRLQVEFERQLRQRVDRVMRCAAPSGLDGRVRDSLRGETTEAVATITPQGVTRRGSRWTRWLADPRQANIAAVAASLALVAGAVLWGIFGRPLDHVPPSRADVAADAATFAAKEHNRCVTNESALLQKTPIRTRRELEMDFSGYLEATVLIPDLRGAGYQLLGGGHCELPGPARSVHLLYRRPATDQRGVATVSIFAAPNLGQFQMLMEQGLVTGSWYEFNTQPRTEKRVDFTTDGSIVYFLVCCDEGDVAAVAGLITETMRGRSTGGR